MPLLIIVKDEKTKFFFKLIKQVKIQNNTIANCVNHSALVAKGLGL